MVLRMDMGIDLGTNSVLVYIKGKGIILQEPSVVAIDTVTNKVLAIGSEARDMLGRTPGHIVAIRPLKDGAISDYDTTQKMLKYYIKKSSRRSLFKPRLIICVPSGITDVERRAVIEASNNIGVSKVTLIEEPIAAAIGSGIDITEPYGNMIIDIGGGSTDIAVIALGGIVTSESIKVAGDKLDQAIINYVRKEFNIIIGERTAENIKQKIASVYPLEEEMFQEVRGRNMQTGLPIGISVSSNDLYKALRSPMSEILAAIRRTLEKTPPELAADIATRGVYLAGGGGLLRGIDKLITEETGIKVHITENPLEATINGTGMALKWLDVLGKSEEFKVEIKY